MAADVFGCKTQAMTTPVKSTVAIWFGIQRVRRFITAFSYAMLLTYAATNGRKGTNPVIRGLVTLKTPSYDIS